MAKLILQGDAGDVLILGPGRVSAGRSATPSTRGERDRLAERGRVKTLAGRKLHNGNC